MKKYIVFTAAIAAALLAASCNKEAVQVNIPEQNNQIAFGTYAARSTKSGATGEMTTAALQGSGFGVFAYHHDASAGETAYGATSTPDFMYNQQVTYSAPNWVYTPIKYWPNEHGNAAASDQVDKVSFFAYGPYVASPVADSEGINAFSANDAAGDPKVSYKVAAKPQDNVDLIWAVAESNTTWETANGATTVTIPEGMPFLNLIKPKTNGKINFFFKHATTKLLLNVKSIFDEAPTSGTTKITIGSVVIKGDFARAGVLNLNNTAANTALWESKTYDSTDPANETVLTINAANNLRASLVDAGDKAYANQPEGVTTEFQALMADNMQFNVIPGGIKSITITYFVTTTDANLDGGYSRVENVITKTFDTPLALENNKAYTLNLQLGMTSVKVGATVAPWSGEPATVIDLPANVAGN